MSIPEMEPSVFVYAIEFDGTEAVLEQAAVRKIARNAVWISDPVHANRRPGLAFHCRARCSLEFYQTHQTPGMAIAERREALQDQIRQLQAEDQAVERLAARLVAEGKL